MYDSVVKPLRIDVPTYAYLFILYIALSLDIRRDHSANILDIDRKSIVYGQGQWGIHQQFASFLRVHCEPGDNFIALSLSSHCMVECIYTSSYDKFRSRIVYFWVWFVHVYMACKARQILNMQTVKNLRVLSNIFAPIWLLLQKS